MPKRRRRTVLFGAAAVGLAAALGGCLDLMHWSEDRLGDTWSYFRSDDRIEEAAALAARARERGADRVAPYQVSRAEEYLKLARAKHASGDYPAAESLAGESLAAAREALRLQEEREGAGAASAEQGGNP